MKSFGAIVSGYRLATRVSGSGTNNVIKAEENKQVAEAGAPAMEVYDKLSVKSGPILDILTKERKNQPPEVIKMPQDNAPKEPSDMPSPENSKGDQIERMMAELERLEKPGAIKAGNSQFWLERDNQDSLEKKATD